MKKWILKISVSFDEKPNIFFIKSWQSRPNEKTVPFPENEKRNYIETHSLRKSENFFSKNCSIHYFLIFKIVFLCKKEQRRKKGKSNERFFCNSINFDNYEVYGVELMKENLTPALKIDKIKMSSLSLYLSLFTFLRH